MLARAHVEEILDRIDPKSVRAAARALDAKGAGGALDIDHPDCRAVPVHIRWAAGRRRAPVRVRAEVKAAGVRTVDKYVDAGYLGEGPHDAAVLQVHEGCSIRPCAADQG